MQKVPGSVRKCRRIRCVGTFEGAVGHFEKVCGLKKLTERRVESSDLFAFDLTRRHCTEDLEARHRDRHRRGRLFYDRLMTPLDVQNVFKGVHTVLFTTRDDGSIYGKNDLKTDPLCNC